MTNTGVVLASAVCIDIKNKKVIKSRFNIVAPWPKPVFSATKMRIILKNRSGL
jgi:hypothetical protein